MANSTIPTRPSKPQKAPKRSAPNRTVSPGSSRTGSKSSTGSGSGSSKGGSASSLQRKQWAREDDAKKKAGQKYLKQAKNLESQAKAWKYAIQTGLAKARDQNLSDVSMVLKSQLDQLKAEGALRAQSFLESAGNADKATASTAEQGLSNLVRERQDSMTAVLEQGAGETDAMKALLMSARNWAANAAESNRAYFDTMSSVNSGITDLNVDMKKTMSGAWVNSEAERDRIWQTYYDSKSKAQTELGNIRTAQLQNYEEAESYDVEPEKGLKKKTKKQANKAFMQSARLAGKSYEQRALPGWIDNYEGQAQLEAKQGNTNLAAAVTVGPMAKAEGASLRKWES